MEPRLLVVSPVRNEAAHIARVARAVAAQDLLPAAWVVVDDRSTDETAELLVRLAEEIPFMRVVSSIPMTPSSARDRLATGAAARTFNIGVATTDWRDYTHVMKLDGDVELPQTYFSDLMSRFEADPELGIACGQLVERRGDRLVRIPIPAHHVHGALKCYSRECFDAIGGVQDRLAWDTIDETYARMRGFRTRNFLDIVATHHRRLGSADGTLRGRARHGECAYIAHFDLPWVVLRSIKAARSRPYVLSGFAFLYGYVRAALKRVDQVPDPEFRRFARWELRQRILRPFAALGDERARRSAQLP